MSVKIYEPIKKPDIEAIRWIGDNWNEVKAFLGDKLIKEEFLFSHPLTENAKKLIANNYKNVCDSEGRQIVYFQSGYTENSTDNLYYGDWVYKRCDEPYFHCGSDAFFNRSYKEKG